MINDISGHSNRTNYSQSRVSGSRGLVMAIWARLQMVKGELTDAAENQKANTQRLQQVRAVEAYIRKAISTNGNVNHGEMDEILRLAKEAGLGDDFETLVNNAKNMTAASQGTGSETWISVNEDGTADWEKRHYKPFKEMREALSGRKDFLKGMAQEADLDLQLVMQDHTQLSNMQTNMQKKDENRLNTVINNLA